MVLAGMLPNPTVDSFVDQFGHDYVQLFSGDHALRVPFGRYRMAVQANGDYLEARFDVDINSAKRFW